MSATYYDQNAQSFFDGTVKVGMQSLYDRFFPYLSVGASIIDAGCGSGRDTKFFVELGYQVFAFDASKEMVKLARKHTGSKVQESTFIEFELPDKVDAIWACASLLHVPESELAATFTHLAHSLKQGGIFYCSFKYGKEEVERDGRTFTNINETSLSTYLSDSGLEIKEYWITSDLRPGREDGKWLNAILIKA